MGSIFEENIKALCLKDSELADRLVKHIVTDVPSLVNENGFYNLVYKESYLHNRLNPLGEAREIFSMAENTPVAIHLVYGIGLGYLFQVASSSSEGTVILYEPDLNILKIAFTLVDFSKDILKKNVFLTDNIERLGEYLYQKSNTKNSPLLLSTISYRELCGKSFEEFVEVLQRMIGAYSLDLKYTQKKFFPLVKNIIKNIPYLVKETPVSYLKDFYKGKTAVVVSAGPTLDRNIETIKKYRDNIVLIVVGTAMKTIAHHGLNPDFLCIIETYDSSKQIAGLDLSQVNLVTEPYSNTNVRKYNFKQTFTHISENLPVNSLWANLINENTKEYLSKGTVSYTSLNLARILGCEKIVLVGQDLAYIGGQCYSKDSAYKDLVCTFNSDNKRWEITAKDFDAFADSLSNSPDVEKRKIAAENRLKNLNASLYYVKGINGDEIPTESVYAAFIKPLTEFTQLFPDCNYINTSLVGAQIDGFENMPLEEALKDTFPIENREIEIQANYDINLIKEKLNFELEELRNIKKSIYTGLSALKNLKNNLKRHRNVDVEVLKDLKKVSSMFIELTDSQQDTIFDFITKEEKIDLDYEMKMAKQFDTQVVNNLIVKFSAFYENAEKKIDSVVDIINKTEF